MAESSGWGCRSEGGEVLDLIPTFRVTWAKPPPWALIFPSVFKGFWTISKLMPTLKRMHPCAGVWVGGVRPWCGGGRDEGAQPELRSRLRDPPRCCVLGQLNSLQPLHLGAVDTYPPAPSLGHQAPRSSRKSQVLRSRLQELLGMGPGRLWGPMQPRSSV